MSDWIPINLDVPAGTFALPLIDFAEPGELAPLPAAPKAGELTETRLGALNSTIDPSVSAGLFGMVDTDTSQHWETRSWDFVSTRDTVAKANGGRVGYRLRWGMGFRVNIQNSKVDSNVKVDGPMSIAWASTLGLTQVSYAVEMFGLSAPGVLAWLPTPGSFDAQTMATLDTQIRKTVSEAMTAEQPDARIHPVPLALEFTGDYARLALNKALSVVFAARHILANVSRDNALERAKQVPGLLATEVSRVYEVWQAQGSPQSEAFALARRTAKDWLDDGVSHPLLSYAIGRRYVLKQSVSADGAGTLGGFGGERLVLRCQAVSASTAQKLGVGDAVSLDATGKASKLIYELVLRGGLKDARIQEGVSTVRGPSAGFRLLTSLQQVDSKLKMDFNAVAAASSLGLARATFDFQSWGLDPKVTAGVLQKTSFNETEFTSVQAALDDAKALVSQQPELLRPQETDLVGGVDYPEHSFPGARLLYLALLQLRKRNRPSEAADFAQKRGFEQSHLHAVYASFWDNLQNADRPPDEVQDEAERFLDSTEPKK
jgi:hypothetical protein